MPKKSGKKRGGISPQGSLRPVAVPPLVLPGTGRSHARLVQVEGDARHKDIFGQLIGPAPVSDQRDTSIPHPPPPSTRRRGGKTHRARMFEEAEAYVARPKHVAGTVNLRPELRDLESEAARETILQLIPNLIQAAVLQEGGPMAGADAGSVYSTPRGRFDLQPMVRVDPSKLRDGVGYQAVPAGLLPVPDGEGRTVGDRYFTTRQRYEIRPPPETARSGEATRPASTLMPPVPRPATAKIVTAWSRHDFGVQAVHLGQHECSRWEVKHMISEKLAWGRGDDLGLNSKLETPRQQVVPKDAEKPRDAAKGEKQVHAPIRPEEKAETLAHLKAVRERRSREAKARKAVKDEELRQWQRQVAQKIDDHAKQEAAEERERDRIKSVWLQAVKGFTFLWCAGLPLLAQRQHRRERREQERAALCVQSYFRALVRMRIFKKRLAMLKALTEELKPRLGYFVFRYRRRRRRAKADIVAQFLIQFMKTNSVKRRISLYVFNVRRLQRVWRSYLKRGKSRMAVLSKQWDRCVTLLRSKGTIGKMGFGPTIRNAHAPHPPHAPATAAAAGIISVAPIAADSPQLPASTPHSRQHTAHPPASNSRSRQSSVAPGVQAGGARARSGSVFASHGAKGKDKLPGATLSTADQRIMAHNRLYQMLTQKQLGLLARLGGYPAVKWVTLYSEVRRLVFEHQVRAKDLTRETQEWESFCEQKLVVESILGEFSQEGSKGQELAAKLLGDTGRTEPVAVRCHVVLHPREMQRHIAQGLHKLLTEHSFAEDHPATPSLSPPSHLTPRSPHTSRIAGPPITTFPGQLLSPSAKFPGDSLLGTVSGHSGEHPPADMHPGEASQPGEASHPVGEAPHARKPWWILHESYWHPHGDDDHAISPSGRVQLVTPKPRGPSVRAHR